jgi:Predicted AAA-ATPase/PD-(D/E)XK nuclease superfamily
MKNLPIGIQSFKELRTRDCVYVDKTAYVHRLATTGKYYFLSRPRRFGKSLLVSTLKELYRGNRAVFGGLWIEPRWDGGRVRPVLHFSFDQYGYGEVGLAEVLKTTLRGMAAEAGLSLAATDLKGMFAELIGALASARGKVVLLVDEYDKPIIDYLETSKLGQARANRDVLRDFYGVLKNADEHLELVFITGISKFSKVSIFSHLNNLQDITIDENYAALTGYTQGELEDNFADYLAGAAERLKLGREELLGHMKTWYNGYSWDGATTVYNPFGTLNFLAKRQFQNFWFATGSPRFLMDQMRQRAVYNVEGTVVNNVVLDKYDIDNLELVPLLFQTGYLTVKELDPMTGDLVLDYPNKEVRESMYTFLIDDLAPDPHRTHTGRTVQGLAGAFRAGDLAQVRVAINALLADLPAEVYARQAEGLYHGLVHLLFSYLGVFVQSGVHSARGRADAVVQTATDVYLFEFKFGQSAQAALDQVLARGYADPYRASGKRVTAIGVNFNPAERQADEWLVVELFPGS